MNDEAEELRAVRPPKAVVFDVGNVLIEWDPRHLYRKLLPDEAAVERFLAEICPPEWNLAQDAGRSWADGVAEAVARHPDQAVLIEAFDRRWRETVPGPIDANVALLRSLRTSGLPVFAITNFSAEKWAECLERFDFLTLFDDAVVSAHERLVKPDPRIYEVLFDRQLRPRGLAPADALFLDDSPANVAASEALGMPAIRVTPDLDLAALLRARGLPV
ncbi:MAG: HAD family phosphatase [Pseudomonadota bacterium]